jgi:uncharacterized protein (DUF427 family)
MMRAVGNGAVIAQAPRARAVEGNHSFPPDTVDEAHLSGSRAWSLCPWKGIARSCTLVAGGQETRGASWYCPRPSPPARRIRNHVAFRNGVRIEGTQEPDA